jgi:hypothetical protein
MPSACASSSEEHISDITFNIRCQVIGASSWKISCRLLPCRSSIAMKRVPSGVWSKSYVVMVCASRSAHRTWPSRRKRASTF